MKKIRGFGAQIVGMVAVFRCNVPHNAHERIVRQNGLVKKQIGVPVFDVFEKSAKLKIDEAKFQINFHRKKNGERMRFKVLHKVLDYKQRNGYHMCVGCGRCDDICPEYISFSHCVNKLEDAMKEVTK